MTEQEIVGTVGQTELEPALVGARAHLNAYGAKLQKAQSFIEALLPFVGGALLAWGAAQMELENNRDGIALIAGGIFAALLHFVISWMRRDDPISAAIEKLSLAEHAFSQTKIAQAVIGERDRLLIENKQINKQFDALGKQMHDLRTNFKIMAKHREAMLASLDNINQVAATLIEDRPKASRSKINLQDHLSTVFGPLRGSLALAFNMDSDEFWTFSIYSREMDANRPVMRRLFALSSDYKEENDQRKWPMGEGFVGEAWASGGELVISDRDEKRFKDRFHGKSGNKKATDMQLYKSTAIMPIRIGQTDEDNTRRNVVGCVIATSNKSGRFLDDDNDPRALNAALVRQLASIARLLVVSWRSPDSPHFIAE